MSRSRRAGSLFDLDGERWRWAKKAWKWIKRNRGAIFNAAVCVAGTALACGVVSGYMAYKSIKKNHKKYRRGEISRRRFAASAAWDVAGVFVKGVRVKGYKGGARKASGRGKHSSGKRKVQKSLRYSYRHNRARSWGRVDNAGSIYKSHRGW